MNHLLNINTAPLLLPYIAFITLASQSIHQYHMRFLTVNNAGRRRALAICAVSTLHHTRSAISVKAHVSYTFFTAERAQRPSEHRHLFDTSICKQSRSSPSTDIFRRGLAVTQTPPPIPRPLRGAPTLYKDPWGISLCRHIQTLRPNLRVGLLPPPNVNERGCLHRVRYKETENISNSNLWHRRNYTFYQY